MTRKLYHKDGREVIVGDLVTSFRGKKAVVMGWPSNGRNRVWVRGQGDLHEQEYFPSVYDLSWEKPA